MVVAQIPLWIIHGTTPTGVAAAGGFTANAKSNTNTNTNTNDPNQKEDGHDHDDDHSNINMNNNDTELLNRGRNQFNMWSNTTTNTNTNTNNTSNKKTPNTTAEKRSAIYCTDISNTQNGDRIATGGGDGKIRIWNLNSLFQTSKVEQSGAGASARKEKEHAKGDDSDNDSNDNDNDNGNVNDNAKSKRRTIGSFKSGGGYDSSDSSECASSTASVSSNESGNSSKSMKSIHGNNTGASDDEQEHEHEQEQESKSKRSRGENGIHVREAKEKHEEKMDADADGNDDDQNAENDNPASSDAVPETTTSTTTTKATPKNREVVDSRTGKKRKRAELIQVLPPRPPPQAETTIKSATTLKSTNNNSTTTATNSMTNNRFKQNQKQPNNQQRLLCTLASHTGSVLTLRFSSSGIYLASAGDDAHVLIYTKTNTPSILSTGNLLSSSSMSNNGAKGNGGKKMDGEDNVEHWERIRILRGHNLDVVGLAWAPDDSHLVSCSLDSDTPICVWQLNLDGDQNGGGGGGNPYHSGTGQRHHHKSGSGSILHPYKILGRNEHTSTVKGVAFDPAGKYVASSGDDPSICIWRAFDDWGLEARVDSSSGVFRSKKKSGGDSEEGAGEVEEDMQALANLSLFRRISFAPDGTHVCGTNATLRGKNIAAMISRNGWGVSVPKKGQSPASNNKGNTTAGAANLVGHKQPVVSSRHCPYFFEVKSEKDEPENDEGDDSEPNYSTLVALGDKRGFVSIWSTKKSRPIFKLQCSESRCTVTDIAWGLIPSSSGHESIAMLVSLLDGFMVALKFDLPHELGTVLSKQKKHRIFRLKYGIELGSIGSSGRRLVDDKSGPKLIENVLQYAMEDDEDDHYESSGSELSKMEDDGYDHDVGPPNTDMDTSTQIESRSKNGKKRIQPVLLNESGHQSTVKSKDTGMNGRKNKVGILHQKSKGGQTQSNGGVAEALHSAEKAVSAAKGVGISTTQGNFAEKQASQSMNEGGPYVYQNSSGVSPQFMLNVVPPKANHGAFTVQLQQPKTNHSVLENNHDHSTSSKSIVATCINSTHSPPGIGKGVSCTTLSIIRGANRTWRDHILGTHCTSIAACSSLLVVGTHDGTVYMYGTSPTSGWDSGIGIRSHSPFVMTSSVVHISLKEKETERIRGISKVEMLVLSSDGKFGVYSILPVMKLLYKGDILAPMNQMRSSISNLAPQRGNNISLPELARIFITDSEHLLLVLSHPKDCSTHMGGMVQGFVYNRSMEVWARVSDERFLYSNFYTTVPTSKLSHGLLSSLDETVKGGRNGRQSQRRGMVETSAAAMYYLNEDDENSLQLYATRAHCEDRLACALALQSSSDFKHWFCLYIRLLCMEADSNQLRFIIDMLLNERDSTDSMETSMEIDKDCETSCWWLLPGSDVLGHKKRDIVEKVIIPEMSKNRSLQRLMNEIATELNSI